MAHAPRLVQCRAAPPAEQGLASDAERPCSGHHADAQRVPWRVHVAGAKRQLLRSANGWPPSAVCVLTSIRSSSIGTASQEVRDLRSAPLQPGGRDMRLADDRLCGTLCSTEQRPHLSVCSTRAFPPALTRTLAAPIRPSAGSTSVSGYAEELSATLTAWRQPCHKALHCATQ